MMRMEHHFEIVNDIKKRPHNDMEEALKGKKVSKEKVFMSIHNDAEVTKQLTIHNEAKVTKQLTIHNEAEVTKQLTIQ